MRARPSRQAPRTAEEVSVSMNNIIQTIKSKRDFVRAWLGYNEKLAKFSFHDNDQIHKDIKNKYGFEGDLLEIFVGNKEYLVNKWHHYIPIYDRYFSVFRNKPIRFLEIGVSKGGSLAMWRKYFGEDAVIYGIDIDKTCARFDGIAGRVRIGSQDDPAFLRAVVEEMGGVDVILDDGSHHMDHIRTSFRFLFPQLNDGGIYMVEDLHTAYWKKYGGGYRSNNSFFAFVSGMIDDMHQWYHVHGVNNPEIANSCSAIHVHDSIAVFEKSKVYPPTHSQIGGNAAKD
jgi:hypothetical protein